jgi:hypothetical protein
VVVDGQVVPVGLGVAKHQKGFHERDVSTP